VIDLSIPAKIAKIFEMPASREALEGYQNAAEALLDVLITFGSRIHTEDRGEYERLRKLVEKCQDDLDQARIEFERMPKDLKRSGSVCN